MVDTMPKRLVTLFRYLSAERAASAIRDNQLYFSAPMDFNDPFDCQMPLSFDSSSGDQQAYIRKLFREMNPDMDEQEAQSRAANADQATFEMAYSRVLQRYSERTGILCFSESNDDILMWSHYAVKHSGVCLGFSFNIDERLFLGFPTFKVEYADKVPDVGFFEIVRDMESADLERKRNSQRKFVKTIFLTKSIHWSYEKEWRTVATNPSRASKGLHDYPPSLLTDVIFGCRISPDDERTIRSAMLLRTQPPRVYSARRMERVFGLEIVPEVSDRPPLGKNE
jgi:Protein of unknown function (DUF2971)